MRREETAGVSFRELCGEAASELQIESAQRRK